MDKAEIMRLCNEIDDEVTDIAFNSTHKHIYDCCESIREYLKAISAEITAPAKSNADRIRQMTDEELADVDSPTMRVYKGKDGWRDRYAVICRYDEGGCGARMMAQTGFR